MEAMRTGFDIFSAIAGKCLLKSIPAIRGNNKMPVMLRNRSMNSISSSFNWDDNPGMSDAQNKKLTGVIINATSEVIAVRVTDKATLPLESKVKKLETFPPGQAATIIIPSAMPGIGLRSTMSKQVIIGSSRYCEINPVNKAFLLWRSW